MKPISDIPEMVLKVAQCNSSHLLTKISFQPVVLISYSICFSLCSAVLSFEEKYLSLKPPRAHSCFYILTIPCSLCVWGKKFRSFQSFLHELFLEEAKLRLLLGQHVPLWFGFCNKCGKEALEVAVLAYACCKGKEDTSWSQKPRHLSPVPTSFVVFIHQVSLFLCSALRKGV